jgi:FlaA1/EpsC-like NDP-sugar epimerase
MMVLPGNMNLSETNTPRWIVFIFDVFLSVFAITFAYLLRYNFQIPDQQDTYMLYGILVVTGIRSISFVISKIYAGIVRYATFRDTERILLVLLIGSASIMFINVLSNGAFGGKFLFPFSVILIDFLLVAFLMISTRVLVKGVYWKLMASEERHQEVVIFGAGQTGIIVKQTYERELGGAANIVAFIDHNRRNVGKKIDGVEIFHHSSFESIAEEYDINTLLFADDNIDKQLKKELIEKALSLNIKTLTVPKASDWAKGELSYNQIRKIRIEDLLERDPIKLDQTNISEQVNGKCILVTGAAGSIGSEMVRQLTRFNPKKIILVDQAETPLYDIQLELEEHLHFKKFEVVIGNITREPMMRKIFARFRPNVVYHAAAYKHVPMMEFHPVEAVHNNIMGSQILADLANEFGVDRFVMISTDKAVNPTNVMGASKRIAEIYIQSLNKLSKTRYITSRFGNVLGSNGSVIPRFRRQIESGGPVTVTHPEITRFFMTIPEACQLVLEAGAMGKGGEIFIFDMGESIKIAELAKKMIKLSGLVLGRDIEIEYTGLRPGEKLYEELLNVSENTLPTYHSRIMIAKVREYSFEEAKRDLHKLYDVSDKSTTMDIVKLMKEIVPEFISKNSVYEQLDTKTQLS